MPAAKIVNRRSMPWTRQWSTAAAPHTIDACRARAEELQVSQASFVDAALTAFLQLTDTEIYDKMLQLKHLTEDEYAYLMRDRPKG